MEKKLIGLANKIEIENISGKGILFKTIRIPDEDCSHFTILYEITNTQNGAKIISPIHCFVNPYQRDASQVALNKSILIPENSKLTIQLESSPKPSFKGYAIIEYEVFIPTVEPESNVFITENDRYNAFRVALINLARFFNIPNWEYDNNQILYDKIKQINSPIIKLLKEYITAYNNWFDFYVRIKETEVEEQQAHQLDNAERVELAGLINNRESTLNALQTKFDELQFERFQKLNGLDNVNGLIL